MGKTTQEENDLKPTVNEGGWWRVKEDMQQLQTCTVAVRPQLFNPSQGCKEAHDG